MKLVDRGFAPGTYAADAFPIRTLRRTYIETNEVNIPLVKYLPSWVPFQREAKAAKLMVAKQMKKPFMRVKREMVCGRSEVSLLKLIPGILGSWDSLTFVHK